MSTALLFPGQGSQEPGMGRELAEKNSEAMALWKDAEKISNLPLREIYWEGDDQAMADTRNLQPALTVVNLNLWRELAKGLAPVCAAGHSLGEYSALAAAGVLSPRDTIELVSLRGRLMSEADPEGKGAMAAVVKLPLPEVKAAVDEAARASGEIIVVANHNTPGQFVVSGTRAAIEAVIAPVKDRKGRCIPLPVSGAFHSPLMKEASAELNKALEGLGKGAWNHARFPVFSNASPRPETDFAVLKENLKKQMTSSVFWIDAMEGIWSFMRETDKIFAECGPKGVLTKMVGAILGEYAPAKAACGEDSLSWKAVGLGNSEQIEAFLKG